MKDVKFIKRKEEIVTSEKPVQELIIEFLKNGYSQKQIAAELVNRDIKPNSLSSVEKYLKQIKETYKANTLFHLACILFDHKILEKKAGSENEK
ncbi:MULTISPECIES: helix-turn-helix transcriptional regulator [Chryseobacterium]|uniref:Uncharacterized protein n=1 Tax=Chryseobacterium piscium TaxID=333702 RepID=A0A3D9BRU6_9FLAO|nr:MULTISPECIES: hypothetical protein [Chryseobacterium]MDN5470388.1 hypothetical protein [Lactococcus lactis]REC39982.1 hypothetical protein DRF69_20560 [Chryseobacterium sp. 5_R23647]REC56230.1 hypothetical protein DRF62_03965 [Chryseobacterium piscium]